MHTPSPSAVSLPAVLGLAGIAAYAGALAWAMTYTQYDVWGAILVIPVIIGLNVPLLTRAARTEGERWFGVLLAWAFTAKILGSFLRYWVIYGVYGWGDATGYTNYAEKQSVLWRMGQFVYDNPDGGSIVGTFFLRLVTTFVYTFTGPSPIAAFVVFAAFSFWGQYLMYRAFRISLPDFDHRWYAVLIFFLPSFLFWPSSVGKEAFLMLCVGAAALGAARLFQHDLSALPLFIAGLAGATMVRPHIAALIVAAVLAALIVRAPDRGRRSSPVIQFVAIAALVALTAVFADRAAEFLGVDEFSVESVTAAVDATSQRTGQGGSEFTPVPLTSPLGVPAAFATVLFRPFPWEANNVQALMASAESLLILGLVVRHWRRWKSLPALLRRHPYLVFGLVYTLLFVWAFSRFGNFGIIARQRVLVMPFVMILVALPAALPLPARGRPKRVQPGAGADRVGAAP